MRGTIHPADCELLVQSWNEFSERGTGGMSEDSATLVKINRYKCVITLMPEGAVELNQNAETQLQTVKTEQAWKTVFRVVCSAGCIQNKATEINEPVSPVHYIEWLCPEHDQHWLQPGVLLINSLL